jgi:23S rRNA pseudouridine2605 synthase
VTTNELPGESQLEHLRQGVKIATGMTSPAKVITRSGKVRITIHEGKKRQIRRMFNGVGLSVANLKRIRINKLNLPKIPTGEFKIISKDDIL